MPGLDRISHDTEETVNNAIRIDIFSALDQTFIYKLQIASMK